MIDEKYESEFHRFKSVYNTDTPGKSPQDISFDKSAEIFTTLSTQLKALRAQSMRNAAANCFKDKWMDDAYPNPHQVDRCKTRTDNKQMGDFWRTLENVRESNRYRYQECLVSAGNSPEESVYCVRNYLKGLDDGNAALVAKFQ